LYWIWRCVVISALTFLVDVAFNAMTGVWKKLHNSDNWWYSCLKLSPPPLGNTVLLAGGIHTFNQSSR
jgi:hypothetical protein